MAKLSHELLGKRVGVCLTSGFFGFFHQAGVLDALVECGIRPTRITGTSAGAIVAAAYASGLEPQEIREVLLGLRRSDFWDMGWPLAEGRFSLLAGQRFKAKLAQVLPVHGFEQCRLPLAVGVHGVEDGRVRHLTRGSLVDAVYASSAVPYLFTPQEIDGQLLWDGGVGERSPLAPHYEARAELDAVIVSYLPPHDPPPDKKRAGLLGFLPRPASFFVGTPIEERLERDRRSVALLREAGLRVLVFGPARVPLGPFSLDRGPAAVDRARLGALEILDSDHDALLGCPYLS
ncbi:MAG: patatin-like phospholipase family protein [Myxococcota bacterium]|jgi:NTE family protein|nr:patatin-like phospholipase family protein [Myxococcota bacterium]